VSNLAVKAPSRFYDTFLGSLEKIEKNYGHSNFDTDSTGIQDCLSSIEGQPIRLGPYSIRVKCIGAYGSIKSPIAHQVWVTPLFCRSMARAVIWKLFLNCNSTHLRSIFVQNYLSYIRLECPSLNLIIISITKKELNYQNLKMKINTILLLSGFVFGSALSAAASVAAVFEPFDFDGDIIDSPNRQWFVFSGNNEVSVSSTNGLLFGSTDRDYETATGSQSGTYYLGFNLNINSASGSEYIAGFKSGSSLDGRIFVNASGSDVSFGFSVGASTADTTTGTFPMSSSFDIVASYNPTTNDYAL
jgi:hypothetical protein